ncbi:MULTISPECIES: DUF554 domain-containing protein [Acidaminococcus]|jgi:uncharacterized membrane protein YqgA involved in biofilm formation|uniref:DUF554 domain-containing protein n=1 Tax=Acidaminococcus TaxID=904 RepID=UPI0022E7F204|nr:DUF554 domain-containing protein [Acidaminococcus massiliensis]
MPIGVLLNVAAVVLGGILGNFLGPRLSEDFKEKLTTVFGSCALLMGVISITFMKNLPAVVFAVIAGTIVGLGIRLGDRIVQGSRNLEKLISRVLPASSGDSLIPREEYESRLITIIVLFCASGTGIYGSMVSGMAGDHSILIAKSIMDLPTAALFACELGIIVSFIALPQLVIFLCLFFLANALLPFCTPDMIGDFKACGGTLLLATGFRMLQLKDFPIADMIPAMALVMPLSAVWANVVVPLL